MERFAANGSVGTAIAVALLMAAMPMAGALTPRVILPPYNGTAAKVTTGVLTQGNCKRSGALTNNHWVPKTGNVTGFASASARGCTVVPSGTGFSELSNGVVVDVAIPVKVYTNAVHNFSINWTYAITLIASYTGAISCPIAKAPGSRDFCDVGASAYTYMQMQLYDQTNNSYIIPGVHGSVSGPTTYTGVSNYSYCDHTGTCYFFNSTASCGHYLYGYQHCVASGSSASGTNTTWINTGANCYYVYYGQCRQWQNWTLKSSHKFWIVAEVIFSAYASVTGYHWANTASASVNGATLGNTGWRIASVTVR